MKLINDWNFTNLNNHIMINLGEIMKRLLTILTIALLTSFVLTGCQESAVTDSKAKTTTSSVVKGGGQFPECLVGVWKSNKFSWAFKFEPDGTVIKIRHNMARHVNLEEGVIEMKGPVEDTYALFAMGDCQTAYDPKTRTLEARTFLDDYIIQLVNGVLEGHVEDFFTGKVSEDCTTWYANWRSYPYLKGASLPDREFIDANPVKLVFTKLDLDENHNHSSVPPSNQ